MNDLIIAYQKGILPKSIESALINQKECIDQIDKDIDQAESERNDFLEKMLVCKDIGMPYKGLRNQITRRENLIRSLIKARKAYEAGFLEIPELNRQAQELDIDNGGNPLWYKAVLPTKAPLRVYEDLKHAKELDLFEKIIFYQPLPQIGNDPIIAGRIGRRVFLIANYH